jgi:hypothetical protein
VGAADRRRQDGEAVIHTLWGLETWRVEKVAHARLNQRMIRDDPTVDSPRPDPVKLNRRMLRMITLMIQGDHGNPTRTPLGLYDAAAAVGYLHSAARTLSRFPTFRAALDKAIEAYTKDQPLPNPLPTLPEHDECVRVRRTSDTIAETKHENIALKAENAALKAALARQASPAGYVVRINREEEFVDD